MLRNDDTCTKYFLTINRTLIEEAIGFWITVQLISKDEDPVKYHHKDLPGFQEFNTGDSDLMMV